MKPLVAAVAVLVALAVGAPVRAQTPEIDTLRAQAEQGDADAQFSLGNNYRFGLGVPEDDAEAARWYRKAAEQEHPVAPSSLGVLYRNGEGVPQDYVQAHMWFNLAASRQTSYAGEMAVRERDRLAGQMTPDQIAEAQRLAREWDEAHPRER